LPAAISSDPPISRGVQIVHTENMPFRVTPEGPVEIPAALATLSAALARSSRMSVRAPIDENLPPGTKF
jgi:hypothetical protein